MATEELRITTEAFTEDVLRRLGRVETVQEDLVRKHYEFDKELSELRIDLKYIREGLDQTKGGINKLLWGMAMVFVTYVVGFVIAGGLNVIGQ